MAMATVFFSKYKVFCTVLLILNFISVISAHDSQRQCTHIYPKYHEVNHVHIEPEHVMKKRSIDQNIRILLWYDHSVYRLDPEKFEIINKTVLPKAVRFWEQALLVRNVDNIIRLTRKCNDTQIFIKNSLTYCIDNCLEKTMCGEVQVPEDHLDSCRICNATGQNCTVAKGSKRGEGISGFDFIFYISAMQTERCNKSLTVAYAAHCQQETALDRPIAGYANLCPASISTKPQELETLISTVKHEILHALGFSVSLYAFYRDKEGNPLTSRNPDTGKPVLNEKLQTYKWSEKVIKTFKRPNWLVRTGYIEKEVNMFVLPNVVKEVRNYFNCSELEGAELEDQGEEGTVLTHWEKRIFENEAMTGTHTQNPTISKITLALMEDTGWYKANYSMAKSMSWGKNLGCDFVMKSCKDWMGSRSDRGLSIHPFCNKVKRDPLQTECTDDRSSVALCNLVEYDHVLPEMYQNFDKIPYVKSDTEMYYGGSVTLADYCPYIQEFTWTTNKSVVRGSHCRYEENNPSPDKNFALEKYGNNSKCFDHTNRMWEERSCRQMRQWYHWGSGCYAYRCENGRLHILVANYSYACFHAHQEISIRIISDNWLHKGSIVCPPCRQICGEVFKARGERCKLGEEALPPTLYSRDELRCGSSTYVVVSISLLFLISIFLGAVS